MAIVDPDTLVILKREKVFIDPTARVDSFVKIEGGHGVVIDQGVHINSFCHINMGGGEVIIAAYANVSGGAKIIGGQHDPATTISFSSAAPAEWQAFDRRRTTIGAFACIFAGAIVTPGVHIGRGAVVGAGAVVTKDVPDFEIWAGVPARKIGRRPEAVIEQIQDAYAAMVAAPEEWP